MIQNLIENGIVHGLLQTKDDKVERETRAATRSGELDVSRMPSKVPVRPSGTKLFSLREYFIKKRHIFAQEVARVWTFHVSRVGVKVRVVASNGSQQLKPRAS